MLRPFAARLGCLAARSLSFSARVLPWPLLRGFGIVVGRLGYLLDGRHRRVALDSISRCFPGKSPAEHARLARACYRHIGLAVVEFARLSSLPREAVARLWALDEAQKRQMDAFCAERPAPIFVTGHVGMWEMCGLGHTAAGGRLAAIARPLDNPLLNDLINSIRERFGQRILAKRGALIAALHALKEGTPVAMLLDQNAGKHGAFVPLFGRLASTLPTAAEIALRTGSALVCATTWRDEAAGVHRLRIGRVIRPGKWQGPKDERYAAEIRRITAEYTAEVEAAVREHPEQWLWLHRRWKTRPPEEQQQKQP